MKKYKKILFIYPPFSMETVEDRKETYGTAILPPIGLLTLIGEIEKNKYDVDFIDAELDLLDDNDIFKIVMEKKPDVLGIYCLESNFKHLVDLVSRIKKELKTMIFFGGPYAWNHWTEILKTKVVDFIVIGEGEETCVELLETLNNKGDLTKVRGIAYKEDDKIIKTKARPLIKDLDKLSYPAVHLINIKKYRPAPNQVIRQPSCLVITSRGCPFKCSFCYVSYLFGGTYRQRGVEHVIGEIKLLVGKYGIKEIQFHDDLFGGNKRWLNGFLDRIIEERLDITWSCLTRIDVLDKNIARKMKKAGCWSVFLGIESLDQEILDAFNKDIKVEKIEDGIRMLKKAGIEIRANLILGGPTETPEKAKKVIKRLCKLNPDYARFNLMTPHSGTQIYNEIKEGKWGKFTEGYTQNQLTHREAVFIPFGYKDADELLKMRKYAYRKFYFRPKYIMSRFNKIKSWYGIKRHINGLKILIRRY